MWNWEYKGLRNKFRAHLEDFCLLLQYVKIWIVTPVQRIRKSRKRKLMTFLYSAERWCCKANHHTRIWRDRFIQRDSAKICPPVAKAAETINWWQHFSGDFDELLDAECGVMWEWETLGGWILKGVPTFSWVLLPAFHQVLRVKSQERSPFVEEGEE